MTQMTVVVTGGSAGIGAAICRQLLASGYRVVSLARRPPDFEHIAARYQITSIVNNAGVVRAELIENVENDDLEYLTNLHIGAAIKLVQAALPAMKDAGFGRIVNMSSRAVLGLATRTVYAGTKAALISITRTWALELGQYGITVNAIAAGPVTTEMFTSAVPEDSDAAQALASIIPVRRLGNADDVARATLFFLDPANSYVTGQTLFVCGGSSLGSLIDGGLNVALSGDQ